MQDVWKRPLKKVCTQCLQVVVLNHPFLSVSGFYGFQLTYNNFIPVTYFTLIDNLYSIISLIVLS